MSIERDLKEAFERHAPEARPRADAWAAVEGRIRRAHRRRAALGGALMTAAVVAAAVVLPQVVSSERPSDDFAGPGPSPAESPTASPSPDATAPPLPAGFEHYRGEAEGWRVTIPSGWRSGWFEGTTEFNPPGLRSAVVGEPTVAVEITLFAGPGEPPALGERFEGPRPDSLGGLAAERFDAAGDDPAAQVVWRLPWGERACWPGLACPESARTSVLQVSLMASTDELAGEHFAAASDIAGSLAPAREPAAPGPVRTKWGTVSGDVAYDDLTAAVVRFMDARLEGAEAETWLTPEAKDRFGRGETPGTLYAPASAGVWWSGYEIRGRDDADASSAELTVVILARADGSGTVEELAERIGVGPGENVDGATLPGVVRFVVEP